MNIQQLYKISKYINEETSFLSIKYTEKGSVENFFKEIEKSPNLIRNRNMIWKIIHIILLLVLDFFPIKIYLEIEKLRITAISPVILNVSGIMNYSFFFIFQMIFLIAIGLYYSNKLISPSLVKLLYTLPLSKREISLCISFSILRTFQSQILFLTFGLPIAFLFVSDNPIFILVVFVVSIVNTIFFFSVFVIICEKTNVLGDNHKNLFRIFLTVLISFPSAFLVPFWNFTFFPFNESLLLDSNFTIISSQLYLIKMIPFPFSGCALWMESQLNIQNDNEVLSSVFGFILFLVLTNKLIKTSIIVIGKNVNQDENSNSSRRKIRNSEILILPYSKIRTLIIDEYKNLKSKSPQIYLLYFIFLIISVIYSMYLKENAIFSADVNILITHRSQLIFILSEGFILVFFIFNKSTYRDFYLSLPLRDSDRFKAKMLIFLFHFIPLCFFPFCINFHSDYYVEEIIFVISSSILSITFFLVLVFGKLLLFSKNRKNLTLDGNFENFAEIKWFLLIILTYISFQLQFSIWESIFLKRTELLFNIVFQFLIVGLDILLIYISNQMFNNISKNLDRIRKDLQEDNLMNNY